VVASVDRADHAAERKLAAGVAGEPREVGRAVGKRWTDHAAALPVLAMACGAVLDEQRAGGVLALAGSARARRDDEGGNREGDEDSSVCRHQRATSWRVSS
jgi:hypothetical protein